MAQVKAFSLGGLGAPCCCGGSVCTCSTTVCVTGCSSGSAIVGATVTIKQGSTAIGGGVTAGGGCCAICLDAGGGAGNYTVTVQASGYVTFSAVFSLSCGGTTTIRLQATGSAQCALQVSVVGCPCFGSVAGVTLTIGGQVFTTQISGGSTFGTWYAPGPGTYGASISLCSFQTATFDVVVTNVCSTCSLTITNQVNCSVSLSGLQATATLVPLSGYKCGANGQYAEPQTLTLTDSLHGSCTLTWDSGTGAWLGSIAALSYPAENYGGGANCPASAGFTIHYSLSGCGSSLSSQYFADFCGSCAGGFFTSNAGHVPRDAPAVVPCTNGNPSIGCIGAACQTSLTYGWPAFPLASHVCPMDSVWTFSASALTNPTATTPSAIWTNFGPGTITITE